MSTDTTKSVLNINYRQYKTLSRILRNNLTDTYDIPFTLISEKYEESGGTHYNPETRKADEIAINLFVHDGDIQSRTGFKTDFSKISDYAVLLMIESFYHESEHIRQSNVLVQQYTAFGQDIACALIAFYDNKDFYKDHYGEMAHEMDAEFHGLKQTRDSFAELAFFDKQNEKVLDTAMTDFVNTRLKDKRYPLHQVRFDDNTGQIRKYNDWQEILDDINGNVEKNIISAYDRVQCSKIKQLTTYENLWIDPTSQDIIVPVLCQRPDILNTLNNAPTIRDECRIIASLTCTVFPDLKLKFHALDNVDLSMQTVCRTEFTADDTDAITEMKNRYQKFKQDDMIMSKNQSNRECPEMSDKTEDIHDTEYE